VLTRVASSHIRVGTFQWAAAHDDREALRALADYTLATPLPRSGQRAEPHLALLDAVVDRQARLIARWQRSASSTA
jgi:serine/tyrosine/threonine adenylyltransferase